MLSGAQRLALEGERQRTRAYIFRALNLCITKLRDIGYLCELDKVVDELVVDVLVHVNALNGTAALAAVEE